MGKGTEFDSRMRERQAEIARGERQHSYYRSRPEVRLKADTPAVEVTAETFVGDVLSQVANATEYGVALRSPGGEITAMVVPLERYVEMASATMEGDDHFEATTRSTVEPSQASLAALHIEQVDPHAEWLPGTKPSQHLGRPTLPRE